MESVGSYVGVIIVGGVALYMFCFIFYVFGIKSIKRLWEKRKYEAQLKKSKIKKNPLEELKEWIIKVEDNIPLKEIKQKLLSHGFKKRDIKNALKQIKKEKKNNGKKDKEKAIPELPTFAKASTNSGETPTPRASSTNRGRNGRNEGDGDDKAKHKRVLPISNVKSVRRPQRKLEWDWTSFKPDR